MWQNMKNNIKFGSLAAVFAIAGMAAFGGASAGSASLGFGDARWLCLDHEKSGCLSAIAWY